MGDSATGRSATPLFWTGVIGFDRQIVCTDASIPVLLPKLFLMYSSASASQGIILAVLILTAAFGGALVRLSLEGEVQGGFVKTVVKPLLRALGGGIVCYLAIRGNNVPPAITNVASTSSPATSTLIGFLSGMSSERVFELLSALVDSLVEKVKPTKDKLMTTDDQ